MSGSLAGTQGLPRDQQVTQLINDIDSAMNVPTGFPNLDDKFGVQELRFTAQELTHARDVDAVRRRLNIEGSAAHYRLTFEQLP